jgi:tungstate transport system substrate-binding protein
MCSRAAFALPLAATLALADGALAEERFITLSSTTSTENSGLFDHILPLFTEASGVAVRVVALGTGQAIELARRGDADVLLVHHHASEEQFVAEGFGVERHEVMFNDYVIIGPAADPVGVAGGQDAAAALAAIARAQAPFASRGDDSGTHLAEGELWRAAGLDPARNEGAWYRETGSGMGATLNTAIAMDAYVLSDRGTWLAFENKGDHRILVEGDPRLFNQYGVILVDPGRHPHVKADLGQAFVDWITSASGQDAIASFTINGEQAFFPNAREGES